MMSFLSFSLFLVMSWLWYAGMANCFSLSMIFPLQPQTLRVFYGYLGLTELEIYLWGRPLPPVTLGPLIKMLKKSKVVFIRALLYYSYQGIV
jgi:hypothetical protein